MGLLEEVLSGSHGAAAGGGHAPLTLFRSIPSWSLALMEGTGDRRGLKPNGAAEILRLLDEAIGLEPFSHRQAEIADQSRRWLNEASLPHFHLTEAQASLFADDLVEASKQTKTSKAWRLMTRLFADTLFEWIQRGDPPLDRPPSIRAYATERIGRFQRISDATKSWLIDAMSTMTITFLGARDDAEGLQSRSDVDYADDLSVLFFEEPAIFAMKPIGGLLAELRNGEQAGTVNLHLGWLRDMVTQAWTIRSRKQGTVVPIGAAMLPSLREAVKTHLDGLEDNLIEMVGMPSEAKLLSELGDLAYRQGRIRSQLPKRIIEVARRDLARAFRYYAAAGRFIGGGAQYEGGRRYTTLQQARVSYLQALMEESELSRIKQLRLGDRLMQDALGVTGLRQMVLRMSKEQWEPILRARGGFVGEEGDEPLLLRPEWRPLFREFLIPSVEIILYEIHQIWREIVDLPDPTKRNT